MIDLFGVCFKNLSRKKMRTLLTVLSIAIGIGAVVLISSIGEIGKAVISTELSGMGMDSISVSYDQKMGEYKLSENDLALIRGCEGVVQAAPLSAQMGTARMRGLIADALVCGIDENARGVVSMDLLYGRYFTPEDIARKEAFCIVDEQIALSFYKRSNIVGKNIRLTVENQTQEYKIIGVVATGGNLVQSVVSGYVPGFVYLPYSTLFAHSTTNGFDQIAVKVSSPNASQLVADTVLRTLQQSNIYNIGYKAEDLSSQKDKLSSMMQTITVVLTLIAGISLLVAGLGIMTVMLVSVGERTREIGIKKSIGATGRTILLEFLVEAFTLSLIGSIMGSIIGLAVVSAGAALLGTPLIINYGMVLFSVGFSVFIGVLFGVYPAGIAARMRPVDALRVE